MRQSRLARNRNFNQIQYQNIDLRRAGRASETPGQDNELNSQFASLTPSLRRVKGHREPKEALPPRTFDEMREDEIIKMLEDYQKQRLQEEPLKELEEALMDRTTASLNRRQKIT